MKNVKLSKLINLSQGLNQTRIQQDDRYNLLELYDLDAFNYDMYHTDVRSSNHKKANIAKLKSGDVVINSAKQKATIITERNKDKILTANFYLVEFIEKTLDAKYFVYYFNENMSFKKQVEKYLHGSTLVQKIPISGLYDLEIELINLDKQILIGNTYLEMMKIKLKYQELSEKTERITLNILEDKIK